MAGQNTEHGTIPQLVQGFYSEFFGTFIPGFIAVVSVVSVCMIAAIYWGLITDVAGIQQFSKKVLDSKNAIKLMSSWIGVAVLCAFSYVVGAIIYRRAPKTPDAIAAYNQWKQTDKIGS